MFSTFSNAIINQGSLPKFRLVLCKIKKFFIAKKKNRIYFNMQHNTTKRNLIPHFELKNV